MAKPILKTEQLKNEIILHVEGDVVVQYAQQVKSFFLENATRSDSVILILTKATSFDLAAAQLVYLWRRELQKQGCAVRIEWPESEPVRELLEKSGIINIL